MPAELPRWAPPVLIALPLGALATAAAVLGATVNPLLPIGAGLVAVVFAIGYARPLWLVYAAILALPLEFQLYDFAFFDLSPTKGLLLLGAAGWVTAQIVHRRPLIAEAPLTVPLIVLIVVIVPGLIVAQEKLVVFNQLGIWVAWFCIYQAIIQNGDERFVKRLMIALSIACVGLGLLAITDTGFQGQSTSDGGAFVANRADGGLNSPNGLAALLMTTILPAVCLAFTGVWWKRAAFALAAAIGTYAILLTQSRGGFLGLAAGTLVLITWRPMRRVAIVGVIILAGLAFGGVNPLGEFLDETAIGERIASITETATSTDPRLPVYRATVEVIEDNPLVGVGANDYRSAAVEYGIMTSGAALTHAHNIPLTLAAERGFLGLGAFIFFGFVLARLLARGLRHAVGEKRAMIMAIMAVFVACTAHGLVDYTLGGSVFLGELFVLAGCAVVLTRHLQQSEAEPASRQLPPAGRPLDPVAA